MKGWKKLLQANGQEKAGVAILISDKIDLKTKAIKRDPEGHFINISYRSVLNQYSRLLLVPLS